MSQWSEKIPDISQKSPSTLAINNYTDNIAHFQEKSKKFVVEILTKNFALNLSGLLFFVGLGYSLKWWYKDQFFVSLLKQNLPALSEPQQKIAWETSEYVLKKQNQKFVEKTTPIHSIWSKNKTLNYNTSYSLSSLLPSLLPPLLGDFDVVANSKEKEIQQALLFNPNVETVETVSETKQKEQWKTKKNRYPTYQIEANEKHEISETPMELPIIGESVCHNLPQSDRFDFYPNYVDIKFKPLWQKHTYQRFSGLFPKSTQVRRKKKTELKTNSLDLPSKLIEKSSKQATEKNLSRYTTWDQFSPKIWFKLSARGFYFLNEKLQCNKFKIDTLQFITTPSNQGVSLPTSRVPTVPPSVVSVVPFGNSDGVATLHTLSGTGSMRNRPTKEIAKHRSNHKVLYQLFTEEVDKLITCYKNPIVCSLKFPSNYLRKTSLKRGVQKTIHSIILDTKLQNLTTILRNKSDSVDSLVNKRGVISSSLNQNKKYQHLDNFTKKTSNQLLKKGGENKNSNSSTTLIEKTISTSIGKLSFPLELTNTMSGWSPPIDTLIFNSYFDEIPYKLETASLIHLFAQASKPDTVFMESVSNPLAYLDSRDSLQIKEDPTSQKERVSTSTDLSTKIIDSNAEFARKKENETSLKESQLFEIKKFLKNELQFLINTLPLDCVSGYLTNEEKKLKIKNRVKNSDSDIDTPLVVDIKIKPVPSVLPPLTSSNSIIACETEKIEKGKEDVLIVYVTSEKTTEKKNGIDTTSTTSVDEISKKLSTQLIEKQYVIKAEKELLEKMKISSSYDEIESFDSLLLLNTLNFTFNNLSSLSNPPILLTTNNDASFWMWKLFNPFISQHSHPSTTSSILVPNKNVKLENKGISNQVMTEGDRLVRSNENTEDNDTASVNWQPVENRESVTKALSLLQQKNPNLQKTNTIVFCTINNKTNNLVWEIFQQPSYDKSILSDLKQKVSYETLDRDNRFNNTNKGKKTIVKQKKITVANINNINTVDTKINFVIPKSRMMSGYVYPDTHSLLLKTNLYQWFSKNKKLTLSVNEGLGGRNGSIKKGINQQNTNTIFEQEKKSITFGHNLIADSRDYVSTSISFADKSYLNLSTSLINPWSFYSRSLKVDRFLDNACLTNLKIPITPSTFLLRFFQQQVPKVENKKKVQDWFINPVQHYYPAINTPSVIVANNASSELLQSEATKSCGDQTAGSKSGRYIAKAIQIEDKGKGFFFKLKDAENLNNQAYSNFTFSALLPYQKFNHRLTSFPGFSKPSQFCSTLLQISQGNENVTVVTPKDSLTNTTFEKGEKKGITQSSSYPSVIPRSNRGYASQPEEMLTIKENQANTDAFGPIESMTEGNNDVSLKEIISKRLPVDNLFSDYNTRKISYNGIAVQRNKLTKDFHPFEQSLRQSSIWGTRFLGPENPLTNRQCHFFGQRQLSPLDTNSFQRDYLRELGKELVTQSNLKGFTEKLPSIDRAKVLSFSKKVNSFLFKKRKYTYVLEKQDQWHLLFQEQLRTALEDKRKYPPLTSEEIKNQNSERIKISAPLIMVRFPKEKRHFGKLDSFVDEKVERSNLRDNTFWRPFSYFKENSHYSPLEKNLQELLGVATLQTKDNTPRIKVHNMHKVCAPKTTPSQFSNFQKRFTIFTDIPTQLGTLQTSTPIDSYHYQTNTFFNTCSSLPTILFFSPNYMCLPKIPKVATSLPLSSVSSKMVRVQEVIPENWRVHTDKIIPHYPFSTERYSLDLDNAPWLKKQNHCIPFSKLYLIAKNNDLNPLKLNKACSNILFSKSDIHTQQALRIPTIPYVSKVIPKVGTVTMANMRMVRDLSQNEAKMRSNKLNKKLLPYSNVAINLQWLIQEPLTPNSWAVLSQWIFLVSLLCWIEQMLLENVFPSLAALEQILLGVTGMKVGDRTHVIRVSKGNRPKFQDLAGIDGLLGELSELVLFLRGQQNLGERFLNKKSSYGVLLTGPPGTGKTFLVRALANEAGVPVLILSAGTLVSNKLNNNKPSWSIRHAFRRAKQLTPCILFIDEIDALGKSRGNIVTDINEIVADTTNIAFGGNPFNSLEKSMNTPNDSSSIHEGTTPLQFSEIDQFGQNWPTVAKRLINKWVHPLKSTLLEESNKISRSSLCEEKLFSLLNIGGNTGIPHLNGNVNGLGNSKKGTLKTNIQGEQSGNFNETFGFSGVEGTQNSFKGESLSTNNNRNNSVTGGETTKRKFGPLTQLLVCMDGVSNLSGILVMGATNRPELLDPALTRPGRFERIIRIEKPSEQKRIEILQLYSHNLGIQHQIPWSYLANRTRGLTAADLAVAMNYSSLKAIIQGSNHTIETIEYGLDSITRFSTASFCRLSTTSDLWNSKKRKKFQIKVNKEETK